MSKGKTMKYSILLAALFSVASLFGADQIQPIGNTYVNTTPPEPVVIQASEETVLEKNKSMHISVTGQGVAPMNTTSPAQAYALAKRAAIADAYRAIAEKVKGVRIDGQDLIKNMMVKRSTIRTYVKAMVRNANVVETTFKEGLCEVEMEIVIAHSQFAQ